MLTNNLVFVRYKNVKHLIDEGDVLLFRGSGFISSIIGRLGEGIHSHVGIASWHRNDLECVEFREWKGGRAVNLRLQVIQNPRKIDVYRILSPQPCIAFNKEKNDITFDTKVVDKHDITRCMRQMTGLPYGWKRIWYILTHKLPILKRFYSITKITQDAACPLIYPVCSTAVASCFSHHDFDLVKNRSDQWTEPADIARSPLLQYLFTLCP